MQMDFAELNKMAGEDFPMHARERSDPTFSSKMMSPELVIITWV